MTPALGMSLPSAQRGAPPVMVKSTRIPYVLADLTIASYGPQPVYGAALGLVASNPLGLVLDLCAEAESTVFQLTMTRSVLAPSARNCWKVCSGLVRTPASWIIAICELLAREAAGSAAKPAMTAAALIAPVATRREMNLILGMVGITAPGG